MRLGIKTKLIGSFLIVSVLFITIGIIALQNIDSLHKNIQMTHDHPLTVTRATLKIETLVITMHRSMKDVTLSRSKTQRDTYLSIVAENEASALEQFNIVNRQILGKEGKSMASQILHAFKNWKPIRERVAALMDSGRFEKAQEITMSEGDEYVQHLVGSLQEIEEYAAMKAIGFNKDSSLIARRSTNLIFYFLISGSLLSIIIASWLSLSITRRIRRLNNATQKMAEGNIEQLIPGSSSDELGLLTRNFNTMASRLRSIYQSLENKVEERTKNLEEANIELQRLKSDLEKEVSERTSDLGIKVAKLNKSQRAMLFMVEDLNRTSKQLKSERHKLELANKELEAFAYSVSHDLRAPLRAIDGFTGILLMEYTDKLDDEAKRIGNIIQRNAQKMGQLIDDLLSFSRVGRKELVFNNIHMEKMVRSVFSESISTDEPNKIKFKLGSLHDIVCDNGMMHQVWVNLISNAVKFSANHKQPSIVISSTDTGDNIVYAIEDNGAGFDMRYKDKLFGVFQRLHHENEFKGTGVGLALVQRIIQRHKGEIWAESVVDKGATFYFSLPKNQS